VLVKSYGADCGGRDELGLQADLVSARMGAEKVTSTFFISEPLIEEMAEFSTMAAELEPDMTVEFVPDTTTGDPMNSPDS